jgi:CheY-like chemotaxis protein
LVVTDVLMPVMDGYELVRDLRAYPRTAGIPVVFYTANYLEDEIMPIAEACGMCCSDRPTRSARPDGGAGAGRTGGGTVRGQLTGQPGASSFR